MKTVDEIKGILAQGKDALRQRYNVKALGIFGSCVRGEQGKESDIDILVEFEEPIGLFKFMELEETLEGMLGTKIDLVSRKALKPHIGEHILREVVYV